MATELSLVSEKSSLAAEPDEHRDQVRLGPAGPPASKGLVGNDVARTKWPAIESTLWMSKSYTADLVSLCLICRILKPRTIFEIGTFRGYTALHFALNTPDDARVYTLDLPSNQEFTPI